MLHSTRREGLTFPRIACDACGQPIERARDGIIQLFLDGRVRTVHRHDIAPCDDRRNDGGWMPLEVFLHFLLRGLRFDAQRAKAEAQRWADLP